MLRCLLISRHCNYGTRLYEIMRGEGAIYAGGGFADETESVPASLVVESAEMNGWAELRSSHLNGLEFDTESQNIWADQTSSESQGSSTGTF